MLIDLRQVHRLAELLQVKGQFTFGQHSFDGDFNQVSKIEEVKQLIESGRNRTHQIIGIVKISENLGGGQLRLVSLDVSNHNLAYNHQELIALLEVNPSLANRIGFFKVEGYENLVWAPDIVQLNYRSKLIAKEYGISSAQWSYGPANGVVAFKPYIELLANGKFPFSSDSDVNLSVHDVMHSVSFTALNSTPAARKVMKIAQKRNQSVLKIYSELQSKIPSLASSFEHQATMLASDPMERTMLLTILMTGNYGYFSPSTSRAEGKFFQLQNKEITLERVKGLLRLYSQGAENFKSIHEKLKYQIQSEDQKVLFKKIVQDEIDLTKFASDKLIDQASREIVELFFPSILFSDSPQVKEIQSANGTAFGNLINFSFSASEENID